MFQRRVKSALFIDYENVGRYCPPEAVARWLRWIEDGEFDEGRRRTLVEKRIYWNPSAQQHEDTFKKHGFEVVLCEKFAKLKNGADIRIALDVMESISSKRSVDEYILFAKDTDYVPVLQRLELKDRKSAILVDEEEERVFALYDLHADITIPVRVFRQALAYEPRRRCREALNRITGLLRRLRDTPLAPAASAPAPTTIAAAVQRTIRVTSLKPNLYTAGDAIERELKKMQGFTTRGPQGYCGTGSYKALMKEVAERTPRVRVTDAPGGGVNVIHPH